MSESDFSVVSAVRPGGGPETFRLAVPASWAQGRGTFGGLVIGAMVNAVRAVEPDAARTVRSVSAEICGPVPAGEMVIWVDTLRRGSGLSSYSAELRAASDGGDEQPVLAAAMVTLAKTRHPGGLAARTPPTMPPIASLPRAPVGPPLGPVFTQHLGFWVTGPAPFSGAKSAVIEGWVELSASAWGPAEIVAIADAYWPTVLAMETAPRPVVTVSFALHLLTLPPPGPLYVRGKASGGEGGYVSEEREVWAPDGTLVAVNTQLFAVV